MTEQRWEGEDKKAKELEERETQPLPQMSRIESGR